MPEVGGFYKKTIKDVPIAHKAVLVRADYNVPINSKGEIDDDFRITQSLPTLKFLIQAGCKVVITSHLGRPDGKRVPKLSLEPVAERLAKLLKKPVTFVPDCIGDKVSVAVKALKPGDVALLENVRFYPEEEANDLSFAKKLAQSSMASYFVQDCFGVAHRAHASIVGVTHYLPSVAGLLLAKEVGTITGFMADPKRPLVAIFGGAKVSDKIKVLERFIDLADQIIIGGAMANTFLKANGLKIGKSVFEPGQEAEIKRIYDLARKKVGEKVDGFLLLPSDVAVGPSIANQPRRKVVDVTGVSDGEYILDLGPDSVEAMLKHTAKAGSAIWNGPLGMTEFSAFAYASARLATELAQAKNRTFSLIGGGDTADFILHWDKTHKGANFGHVSTGGGATLELLAGAKLPGVEALLDSN